MPYHNAEPHRLNGPRESIKLNSIEGELVSLEKAVSIQLASLLLSIEQNKDTLSMSDVYTNTDIIDLNHIINEILN